MTWHWCYGNASTRKRTQKWLWVRFHLFSRIIGNPSKTEKGLGISEYFWSVSAIFTFDLFPVFFIGFRIFLGLFSVLKTSLKFSVCWLVSFFSDPFPHFLGPFAVFEKHFKFSVCWSVFSFFRSVSTFFGSVSVLQKKFLTLIQKEMETDPKNAETDQKNRKPINKPRI